MKRKWSFIFAFFLFTSLVTAAARAQRKPFTLEQAMSAPFPTDLTPAPAGGRVAWIFDAQGARNLWMAEPSASSTSGLAVRQITAYTGDDGQPVGEISWSPDGRTIV